MKKRCKKESATASSKSWSSVVQKSQKGTSERKKKKKGLHGYKKGFERNMIVISNQTAPSLFLFTPNWPLSLRGRTEPAMKSLLSPANPAHWAHVHRQPSE